MGDDKRSETMLASFPRPDQAKDAIIALEREGVPARDVHLLNDVRGATGMRKASADDRKVRWLARRWVRGAVIGAVVGVAIAIVAAIVMDLDPLVAAGAVVGAFVAGAFVGGLISVNVGLPRSRAAWDTYLLAHEEEACVAVEAHDRADRIAELLQRAGATSIERAP